MYIQQAKITMHNADGTFWHSDNDWDGQGQDRPGVGRLEASTECTISNTAVTTLQLGGVST